MTPAPIPFAQVFGIILCAAVIFLALHVLQRGSQ